MPRPRLPMLAVLAVATLLAAACTESPAASTTTTTAAASGASSSTDGPEPGRLAVLDDRGAIITMLPDGSERVRLTEDAETGLVFRQPTWSPDGSVLAWTEVDTREGTPRATLVTADGDSGWAVTHADVPVAPFYLYWSPEGDRLAYLGGGGSLELGMLDVAGGGTEAATIDQGQPYYFSWSPDGAELLAHVGTDRLDVVAIDGSREPLGPSPGLFQAPVWSGTRLVYAVDDDDGQRLVVRDGPDERTLVAFDGSVLFVADPTGRRLAFQTIGDQPDAITALGPGAAPSSPGRCRSPAAGCPPPRTVLAALTQARPAGLEVVDFDGGTARTAALDPALAYFWSRDGEQLLSLHASGEEQSFVQWQVWSEHGSFRTVPFLPSVDLARDYLPFFDQYAQSLTFWSPDGAEFVFAGSVDGETGVWVQPADSDDPPRRVSDGVFATWSPAAGQSR